MPRRLIDQPACPCAPTTEAGHARSSRVSSFAILTVFLPTQVAAQPQADTLPIKLMYGKRIIVEATICNNYPVNAMIDTGASCSVISSKIARRLQLRTLIKALTFVSLDRVVRHRPFVIVPNVVLGPIQRTIDCLADDIPFSGVDMIIARDILMDLSFTVDYEHCSQQFGSVDTLKHRVSFNLSFVVELQVGTRKIPVMLDSGADHLLLFAGRVSSSLVKDVQESVMVPGLSSLSRGRIVLLADVRFGSAELNTVEACILEGVGRPVDLEWHGLLGLAELRARRVRFDFPNGLFSWEQ